MATTSMATSALMDNQIMDLSHSHRSPAPSTNDFIVPSYGLQPIRSVPDSSPNFGSSFAKNWNSDFTLDQLRNLDQEFEALVVKTPQSPTKPICALIPLTLLNLEHHHPFVRRNPSSTSPIVSDLSLYILEQLEGNVSRVFMNIEDGTMNTFSQFLRNHCLNDACELEEQNFNILRDVTAKDKATAKKKIESEDLSDGDLALKQQFELYVDWVQDFEPGLQKVALESMRQEIHTSTNSMTSTPKPLKFLCPHNGTLKVYYDTMAEIHNEEVYGELASTDAAIRRNEQLLEASHIPQNTILYLLLCAGTIIIAGEIFYWSRKVKSRIRKPEIEFENKQISPDKPSRRNALIETEYFGESIPLEMVGEIAQEYAKRQSEEAPIADFMELVQQIVAFHIQQNVEPEPVDFMKKDASLNGDDTWRFQNRQQGGGASLKRASLTMVFLASMVSRIEPLVPFKDVPNGENDDDDTMLDPAWPHFQLVYELLFCVAVLVGLLHRVRGSFSQKTLGQIRNRKLETSDGTKSSEKGETITFVDVAGVDEAKEELEEIVEFLRNPDKYIRLGARPPRGVLLVGLPGTGKTLLAKVVAGEADVPFISCSASEFDELYVGMGASRVRDLFAKAKKEAPSIIFIDEIDAVAKSRDGKFRIVSNDEREQTLNQLLTEMDGFDSNSAVIVLGATNRADVLDPALRRPGRFDRVVMVETPDRIGRESILKVHVSKKELPLANDVYIGDIASMTTGFTRADLANLVNEAAVLAGRKDKVVVEKIDLIEASKIAKSLRVFFNWADYLKFYKLGTYWPYTPSIQLLYGLRAALDLIFEEGLEQWDPGVILEP